MAVLLAFELNSRHTEVREKLLSLGFLNSMVGYHTAYPEKIQSDLPSTFLFRPDSNAVEALSELRTAARSFGIDIDDTQQRAFAITIEPQGAVDWRGIISRLHPLDKD
jgi:hypothetical protein